jgi:hypothetical protein
MTGGLKALQILKIQILKKMSENNNKSFAERFGKKNPSFSQQALDKIPPQPAQKSVSEMAKEAPKPLKPVDPIKKMQANLIYLVKGIDAGRNAWYYVLVDRLKTQLFLKALNDDIIHLEEYGKILFSAYGKEPPSHITEQLKEEYGID